MKEEFSEIDEGFMFAYLIPALILAVAGGVMAFYTPVGFVLIVFGVVLLFAKSGIAVDQKEKRLMKYAKLFGNRRGDWVSLKEYDFVELKRTRISQVMRSRGTSITHRIKTYDLILCKEKGTRTEFHDFTNYKKAKTVLKWISEMDGLAVYNRVEEGKAKMRARPKSR